MGTLKDLLEIRYGKDHKQLNDGDVPVYGSGGYMRSVERFLFNGESVLIPRKGSLNNVMYVSEKFWTVDTMFYAVPIIPNAAKYAYQFIKRLDLASMNSGSAVPSMTTKILNALPVPIPPKESLYDFDGQLQPYYSKIRANTIENEWLAALRDALLPKLMSGEIDVSEVDLTSPNSHLPDFRKDIWKDCLHACSTVARRLTHRGKTTAVRKRRRQAMRRASPMLAHSPA